MARNYLQGELLENFDAAGLDGTEFNDCVFKNCRWNGVRVQNCTFLGCTFEHCSLSGVVFSFCQMQDAWLLNSGFRAIAWGGLQGRSILVQPIGKAENCAFLYNEFSSMALAGFDFSSCTFTSCTFDDCKLTGANFNGARLGRSQFTRCDLQKADFRMAEGYAIDPSQNQMKGARFSFPDVVALLDQSGIVIE